jgi:cell pole-organizing protein PopZ
MEEILASIRKIIAEDPPGGEEAAGASAAKNEEPEVLDLTQEVHVEGVAATSFAQPPEEDRSAPASDEATMTNGTVPSPSPSSEGIFSEKTRKALNDAFAGLEPASTQTGNEEQVPSMHGLPIEAVFEKAVREAFDPVLRKWLDDNAATLVERMKPVISEWLDRHFPAMLEDAVRNEVARAVMARGRH